MLCAVKIGSWRWSIGLQSQPMTTRFLVRFLRPPIFFGEPAVLKYVHCQHTQKKIMRQISNPSNAGLTGLNWLCLGTKKCSYVDLECSNWFFDQLKIRTNASLRKIPKSSFAEFRFDWNLKNFDSCWKVRRYFFSLLGDQRRSRKLFEVLLKQIWLLFSYSNQ